ncbi:MAG: hypothetical protein ACWIPH_00425 [Ostreibacterium sp.]
MTNKRYPRALENLPEETVEAWLFESLKARHQVEREWQKSGKTLKLRSAYKTLLHTVLEDNLLDNAKHAIIRYPIIAGDEPSRFRLECYPLSELVACELVFEGFDCTINAQNPLPYYEIIVDGVSLAITVPVRWIVTLTGDQQLVTCGWSLDENGTSAHLLTEFEAIYDDVCQYLSKLPLVAIDKQTLSGPFFNQLRFDIGLPIGDTFLPVGNEQISLIEALHEDIYFSALEIFQHRLGLPSGDRRLTPGQIIPSVSYKNQPSLSINIIDNISIDDAFELGGCPHLDNAGHWLTAKQIQAHLQQLKGEVFSVTSRQGRPVLGCAINTEQQIKLAISGGQHANESSGVVGALRAAAALKRRGDVALTVCPSENVDGYALFRSLCQDNPHHMHHAARYTAAGNDLTDGRRFESHIRDKAKSYVLADVHINLHGYPSHEWTRPLSGYVPKGFADWTIPKGFFLICRYQSGQKILAQLLLKAAITAVIQHASQAEQNDIMLQRYLGIVEQTGFKIADNTVPFIINEYEQTDYPIEIITEAPDETVYGEDFRIAHETHLRVIMAIAEVLSTNKR